MKALPRIDATTDLQPPAAAGRVEGDALADSQLRRALSSSQVGSWTRDLVHSTARVDAAWCAALDIDPCDGPDHLARWSRRIHPDDIGRFQRAADLFQPDAVESPEFEVEYRILTRASQWLWILQRGRVTRRDAAGRAIEAGGICIDIDARKRAEVEVHENESRLATALWGAQAAFWQWHIPSDAAVRSPLWYAMTGYSHASWHDRPAPWLARVHPEDLPNVDRLIKEHLEGRTQSLELTYRITCASGQYKWILDRGRVVEWDFDGRATAAIGVSMDIDVQKRSELALRSSEARLETAIWGAGVGLYEMDCKSGATRWLNDWCERFDIDPCAGEEHVDRWDSNIHPDDLPAARARFSGHLEGIEEYYDAEYRIRTRSGIWRWVFERGRVVEHDALGQPVRLVGTCMDIDERKRAEVEVEESQRRLQLALEGARGCLWEWNVAQGRYNDAYYELHGVAAQEGRKDPLFWRHRAHPEDVERVLAAEQQLIEGRIEFFDAQYRVRHADGNWRWMVDRFRAVERDEAGCATKLIGFAVDITEEMNVREALHASESMLRVVTENTSDWLFLFDHELRCTFCNRPVRSGAPAEVVGKRLEDLAFAKDRDAVMSAARSVLANGAPQSLEQVSAVPGDLERHIEMQFRAARIGSQIIGVVVTATDVTERVRQREALAAQAQIIETMREAVLLIDSSDRVRLSNPAFDELAGVERGSLTDIAISDLLRAAVPDYQKFGRKVSANWTASDERHSVSREFDWRCKDGSTRRLIGTFTPVELRGEALILGVYSDVSRQRGLERDLLETTNREQQRIGSDLHDGLGQELTGIALMLRGLASEAKNGRAPGSEELEEVTRLVSASIETTRAMVRGVAPVTVQEGGLNGALQTLATQLTQQSGVQVVFTDACPTAVSLTEWQSTHLYRLAQEAVSNSLRHGAPSRVDVVLNVSAAALVLEVRDDGRGFPDRFESSQGLGLNTMKYRAQVLGGELAVESTRHGGVSIRCAIPVH